MFPKDRIRNQRLEEIETDVEEKGKEEEKKQQKENYLGGVRNKLLSEKAEFGIEDE